MEIVILIFLVLFNAVLALAEMAFAAASPGALKSLAGEQRNAHYVLGLRRDPDAFLSMIQVGITLVGIVSGAVSGLALADDLSKLLVRMPLIAGIAYPTALVFLVLVVTYFTIVFGELIPKTLALRNPEGLIMRLAGFVKVCMFVFHPLVLVLSSSVKLFYRLSGIKSRSEDRKIDLVKQIIASASVAAREKKIEKAQEQIIRKAVAINRIKLHEIMVARKDIRYLRTDMSLADALLEAHTHQHTRYPIVDPEKNETAGYVNFKDIINVLKFNPRDPSIRSICRPIIRFDEQLNIVSALNTMTKNFQHIALVVDRDGREVGLIALEDIVETLVGDIHDEYDYIPDYLYKIAGHRYIAGGKVYLSALNRTVDGSIPRLNVTLNDWLAGHFGAGFKVGSRVRIGTTSYTVKKLSRAKIYEVIIEKPEK